MNTKTTRKAAQMTPEERQARDESRRAQLDQALIDGVQSIAESESFKAVLAANAKFHSYSANNAMLIWAQCPTAERVAGYTTWAKLRRQVRKGEKGIMIYAPRKVQKVDAATGQEKSHVFFGIEYVFDIAQTEGEEIPQFDCPTLTEEIGHEYYARLAQYAEGQGLTLTTDPAKGDGTEAMGYYSRSAKEVWIRQAPMAQMLKTGIHELAHHHDEEPNNREAKETIAEGVAFQVCAYFGIDTSERSFPYIAHWASAEGGPELIKRLLGHIQKLTKQMIAALSPAEPTDTTPEPEPPAISAAQPGTKKRRTVSAA